MHDFRRHEYDAQCNASFDRRPWHKQESERCTRECQAVGDGERRDGRNEPRRSLHQNKQCEDEQQMVNAEQDMFNSEHEVTALKQRH